jgi:hypothetical protein
MSGFDLGIYDEVVVKGQMKMGSYLKSKILKRKFLYDQYIRRYTNINMLNYINLNVNIWIINVIIQKLTT